MNALLLPSLEDPVSLTLCIKQHYLSNCSNKEPSFTISIATEISHTPNLNYVILSSILTSGVTDNMSLIYCPQRSWTGSCWCPIQPGLRAFTALLTQIEKGENLPSAAELQPMKGADMLPVQPLRYALILRFQLPVQWFCSHGAGAQHPARHRSLCPPGFPQHRLDFSFSSKQ